PSTLRVGGRGLHLLLLEDPTGLEDLVVREDQGVRILLGASLPRRERCFKEITVPGGCFQNSGPAHSQMINDFETTRTRFHNQFVCQTPLQLIERLQTTKRFKGMSAEVWGDQVSSLCDAAQCFDPQMRYEYFLSGLRNSEWKAALATTKVNSIPEAVAVLL
ncbi:hypothetical protein L914_21684, partial [Phytophthora nicotianae]